mmetsp:Transcript_31251/g.76244  ORF Transcript_31251/g.76244 Transcript_31251/m.76244 type:complete len:379 (+) Transcript_31251:93-1229(+)
MDDKLVHTGKSCRNRKKRKSEGKHESKLKPRTISSRKKRKVKKYGLGKASGSTSAPAAQEHSTEKSFTGGHESNMKATKKRKKRKKKQQQKPTPPSLDSDTKILCAEVTEALSSKNKEGTLSDWLNPSHPFHWPALKSYWKRIPKSMRKIFVESDKKACLAQHTVAEHPFPTTSDDHCETAPEAYEDIECILEEIRKDLGKSKAELQIYDPYYCNGAVVNNFRKLGYTNVYNKCEDFYSVHPIPKHDVLITNPPYSSDHVQRLINFVKSNGKPTLLLMPNYVHSKPFFPAKEFMFVLPKKRYVYWTPKGLRPKEKTQNHVSSRGIRTSPFMSFWYVSRNVLKNSSKKLRRLYNGQNRKQLPRCFMVEHAKDLPKQYLK